MKKEINLNEEEKQMNKVQIDKYRLQKSAYYGDKNYEIFDKELYKTIISFNTDSEELNLIFGQMLLDELNTGKYEKYMEIKDEE